MDPPWIEHGFPRCKRGVLPLDYGPVWKNVKLTGKVVKLIFRRNNNIGGDPSAGSPTDTLWRLNLPCHTEIRLRRVSPKHNSVGLTGSVCKRPWHIHRSLITNDYYGFHRHEVGLQTSICTKPHFRRLASLLRVASHWMWHCRARVAQEIRAVPT